MSGAQDMALLAVAPGAALDLAKQLARNAAKYCGGDGDRLTHVRLVRHKTRANCTLYEFALEFGARRRRVMVKVPASHAGTSDVVAPTVPESRDRPRLFPALDPSRKAEIEYTAMARIQTHFESLGDPRLGFIRLYDLIPETRAMIMQAVHQPSLSTLLVKKARSSGPFSAFQMGVAFRNSGVWLRAYHQLPGLAHTQTRHVEREDLRHAMAQFMRFLEQHSVRFIAAISQNILKAADRLLPRDLPLGMLHGDYAPRNILVAASGRVTVLDTLARWRAPALEDIGHFLIALKAHRVQVFSQSLFLSPSTIARYEDLFLRGYFGDSPIPLGAIRVFECLAVLEKWAAVIEGCNRSDGWRRIGNKCVLSAWARHLHRTLIGLLREISNKTH